MPSRDPNKMDPELRTRYEEWLAACHLVGLDPFLTCTSRTYQEQVATYAQGREPVETVHALRALAGMRPISDKEAKRVVSWTMASKHIVNLSDSDQSNDLCRAFDFALWHPGRKASWDTKADVNGNNVADYEECGRIAESMGLVWGGRWKKPDYAHIELPTIS